MRLRNQRSPRQRWGGSVMAALSVKNIPTGVGDDIKADVSYAKGATRNVFGTAAAAPSFAMFGRFQQSRRLSKHWVWRHNGCRMVAQNCGGDGRLHLTKAFGLRGAFNHNWDPYWSSTLFGSYSAVRYDGAAKASLCAVYTTPAKSVSADYVCNPDFNVSQLGIITHWIPSET